MKYAVWVTVMLMSCVETFSQQIPSDSILLRSIFGTSDAGGKTVTCAYSGDETISSYQEQVVYSVVFKEETTIDNKDVLVVIVQASYGTLHGHQLGYQNVYFFKSVKGKATILDSIKSDGIIPIGDAAAFEIVHIGKGKKALISTFQSSGNSHFENTQDISLLELHELTYLFSIHKAYDNSCCVEPVKKHADCNAERYEEVYEIVESTSEWYTIHVTHKDFGFTKGCKESFVRSESVKEYVYVEGKYVERK